MNLSKEAMLVFQKAIEMASSEDYEYVTPEMVLLMIIEEKQFIEAYKNCGGDLQTLKKNALTYSREHFSVETFQTKILDCYEGIFHD